MGDEAKPIINQALKLSSREERAIVAEQFLLSLNMPNADLDEIWAKEAEARITVLENGELRKVYF